MIDATVSCAICDVPVYINLAVWNSIPNAATICDECDEQVSWPVFLAILRLRYEVSNLRAQLLTKE